MRKWIAVVMFFAGSTGWSMPSAITYQGTLKQSGVPVNAVKNMVFQISDPSGTMVYWTSPSTPVTVNQGLFSVDLTPTGIDWQNVTPYIQVQVEGVALAPREPLNVTRVGFLP